MIHRGGAMMDQPRPPSSLAKSSGALQLGGAGRHHLLPSFRFANALSLPSRTTDPSKPNHTPTQPTKSTTYNAIGHPPSRRSSATPAYLQAAAPKCSPPPPPPTWTPPSSTNQPKTPTSSSTRYPPPPKPPSSPRGSALHPCTPIPPPRPTP